MILTVDLNMFRELNPQAGSPVYYTENSTSITMYMAKPPFIIKTIFDAGIDAETGLPATEELLLFKESFLSSAIRVLDVKEENVVRMVVSQG